MDDQELNEVLSRYSEAWRQYVFPPACQGKEPTLPAQARAAINKLQAEASVLPDPGGPISNYIDALAAWAAANHPDIDWAGMNLHVLQEVIVDHR